MSYTIEYDRQFIRSGFGYTPLWLAGDNNVYVTDRKRSRSWHVFGNQLGVSKQALLTYIEPMLNEYDQHWKKNGKWVTNAGLKRWIENGCKSSATIEEVLNANHLRFLRCSLRVYPKRDETHDGFTSEEQLKEDVYTTEDFDRWIADVKAVTPGLKAEGASVYPCVGIYTEKINHPNKKITAERVLIKSKSEFLIEPPTSSGSSWSSDVRKAWVFTREEAELLQSSLNPYSCVAQAKLVDAAVKDKPFDAVIQFADGPHESTYVQKFTNKCARLCRNICHAHHYPDAKAAARAIKTAQPRFPRSGTMEVVIDPDAAKAFI